MKNQIFFPNHIQPEDIKLAMETIDQKLNEHPKLQDDNNYILVDLLSTGDLNIKFFDKNLFIHDFSFSSNY